MTCEELHDLWRRLTEWLRCIKDMRSDKWYHVCETRRLVEVELWEEYQEKPDEL